jgi:hypothetical protein
VRSKEIRCLSAALAVAVSEDLNQAGFWFAARLKGRRRRSRGRLDTLPVRSRPEVLVIPVPGWRMR